MADNDIIKHSDIAESGAVKPLTDEFLALYKVLIDVDAQVVRLAKDLKVTLSSTTADSSDGIKRSTKAYEDANRVLDLRQKTLKEIKIAESKLVEAMDEEAKYLSKIKVELEQVNAQNKENAKIESSTTSAYQKAVIELRNKSKVLKDLYILGKTNTQEYKNMKKAFDDLFVSVSKAEQSVNQHQRNVGNYASGFSAVNHSITQLTRELPAFANSFQTGIMAISNNVGALQDALKGINAQNAILKANGEKTVPAWRQLTSAFLSWNTVLSVGITLATVYSKEIGEFVANLFNSSRAIDLMKQSQEKLNALQETSRKNAVEENVKLTILLETAKNVNLSLVERKKAVEELQETYPKYFANLSQEKILAGDTAKAELELRDAILSKARAQAATDALIENEKKRIDLIKRRNQAEKDLVGARKGADAAQEKLYGARGRELEVLSARAESAASYVDSKVKEISDLNAELKVMDSENKFLIDSIMTNTNKAKNLDPPKKQAKEKQDRSRLEDLKKELAEEERLLKKSPQDFIKLRNELYKETQKQQKENNKSLFVDATESKKKMDAALLKLGKEFREEEAKEAEAQRKAQQRQITQSIDLLTQAANSESQIRQKKIDTEIDQSKRRQDELRQLAVKGSLDAGKSLAFEERRQAELEAKRLKTLKSQKRQELLFAGLKAYSSNVEKNPQTALTTTLKDITVLSSALAAIPGFIEGTENVAESLGKPHLSGKDGYIVRVDGDERIVNPDGNKKITDEIGKVTNDQLIDLAILGSKSIAPNMPVVMHYNDDRQVRKLEDVKNEIKDLKNVIENRPIKDFRYNDVTKMAEDIITTKFKTEITKKRVL